MNNNPIGVFDSGIGGLTVLSELKKVLKNENFLYLADKAFAPYGNRDSSQIKSRAFHCTNQLILSGAKAVVVACNTATGAAISDLREKFNCPFVGLEPAIKPLYDGKVSGKAVLLCTDATLKQPNMAELKKNFAAENLCFLPQKSLAYLIETNLKNKTLLSLVVSDIFTPHQDAEAVILGCTHYVFLKPYIHKFYNGNIKIFDGNRGAANQLKKVLLNNGLLTSSTLEGSVKYFST